MFGWSIVCLFQYVCLHMSAEAFRLTRFPPGWCANSKTTPQERIRRFTPPTPAYPGSVSSRENPLKNACRNTGAWPGKAKISFTILFCHLVDNYAHVTIFFVQYWVLALRIYSRYIFFMTLNVCICCLWRSLENKLLLSVEKSTMQTHNFQNQSSARFLENYPVGARFLEP